MPTPSRNSHPQQLSSRSHTHTSTCPEEPRSWRPSDDDVAYAYPHSRDHAMSMHVDPDPETASPNPEPVGGAQLPSSSSSSSSSDMLEEDATTAATIGSAPGSRSNTTSPGPESQSAETPASTNTALTVETETETEVDADVDTDGDQLHHKPMELEEGLPVSSVHSVHAIQVETSSAPLSRDAQPPQHHQQPSSPSSTTSSQQQQHHQRLREQAGQRGQHRHDMSYDMSPHNHKPDGGGPVQDGFWDDGNYAPSMGYGYSNLRILPSSPSSFLRPGSRFHGTQQSERQVYDVQVEIKYVDFRESFLCGYLKIQGLTEDNPTLTTYFEGEIIGSKYGFLTQHPDWGATDKIDMNHWSKFTAFRQYKPALRAALYSSLSSHNHHSRPDRTSPAAPAVTGNLGIPMGNAAQRENIFMRWKEHFLVPDHKVKTINGASFEGFYYICFNQKKGEVKGIYFHSKSEKFQQLDLAHVEDKGCFSAMEFR